MTANQPLLTCPAWPRACTLAACELQHRLFFDAGALSTLCRSGVLAAGLHQSSYLLWRFHAQLPQARVQILQILGFSAAPAKRRKPLELACNMAISSTDQLAIGAFRAQPLPPRLS